MATIQDRRIRAGDLEVLIRSAREDDAEALLDFVPKVDAETDFLLREPGEFDFTLEAEREFLKQTVESPRNLFLVATVDGRIVGTIGFTGSELARFQHQGEFWDERDSSPVAARNRKSFARSFV